MDVTPAIRTAPPPAPPSHYLAYLNSPAWKMRRNKAIREARWQCQRCPSKRGLQVHHVTYERLGAELDRDLEVVCENCHRDEHLANPGQTSLGVYLKLASSLIGDRPYSSVTDLADDMKRRCVALKIPMNVERINGAITVICGNRLSPAQAEHELKYAHIPTDGRPISHAEAREFIGLLGIEQVVSVIAKTMPSNLPRDARTHTLLLAEQVEAEKAARRLIVPAKRRPFSERLEAIFQERWD